MGPPYCPRSSDDHIKGWTTWNADSNLDRLHGGLMYNLLSIAVVSLLLQPSSVETRIMEADPRVPRFIERDPKTGEITKVDIDRIKSSPQFSRVIERTITGWEGKEAPPFSLTTYDGKPVTSGQLAGQPHLVYFWFTNCPPCVRSSPILAELYNKYASQGFKIVGVNADKFLELPYDDKTRAEYVKKYGFKFTTAYLNEQ